MKDSDHIRMCFTLVQVVQAFIVKVTELQIKEEHSRNLSHSQKQRGQMRRVLFDQCWPEKKTICSVIVGRTFCMSSANNGRTHTECSANSDRTAVEQTHVDRVFPECYLNRFNSKKSEFKL